MEIFDFLPRLIGAGLIFFVGLIVARIVKRLVETVLIAANVDGLLARDRDRRRPRAPSRTAPDAVPPGAAPGSDPREPRPRRRSPGLRPDHHPGRDRRAAGARASKRSPARRPRCSTRSSPRSRASSPPRCGSASPSSRRASSRSIIEAILPPTGFDDAIRSTGVLPATAYAVADRRQYRDDRDHPRRVDRGARKQLGGGTIAIFLAQVTELGGKVIFGTLIIVVGIFLARIIANLVGSGTGEGGYRADDRPLCDHRSVHRDRPHLHGPCRPDRDDGVRADPRLGGGRDRAGLRPWRARCRGADRSIAGPTQVSGPRARRRRPSASAAHRRATTASRRWCDRAMTFDEAVAFALTLPDTELSTSYGKPAVKVASNGRAFLLPEPRSRTPRSRSRSTSTRSRS